MRVFVSVDLPPDLTASVKAVQDRFADASGLNFTDPSQAHITLKFLGEVPPEDIEDIEAALTAAVREVEVPPFEAIFRGLGAFPSTEYIRVVWLGVADGTDEFMALHEAIERRFTDMGFPPEEHSFTPHVTLARMEHAGGKDLVQRGLEDDPVVGSMQVTDVCLTESTLTPDGPEYSTLIRVPLTG